VTEGLVFHGKEDTDDFYIIALTKDLDGKTFTVDVDFDDDWQWKLNMDSPANYEMVKHMIMDAMFACDNEDELLMELDSMFEEMFGDIVEWDCEACCDCDTGCNHCGCK
jgi:hypothetical protein